MKNFGKKNDTAIIMTVYINDNMSYLSKAINSIFQDDVDMFILCDGIVNKEISYFLNELSQKDNVFLFQRNTNLGLAISLNELLDKVIKLKYVFVARMDSDDISEKDRLYKQKMFLENNPKIDVVGTWIAEIDEDDNLINPQVEYPLTHSELFDFFAKRDPLAHPTVMFRNTFFEKAGLYSNKVHLAEDTLLWYSGFVNNCRFANIPYVGLKFRRTSAFYLRRANWKKSWGLLKFRLLHINRKLGYGFKADLYAIAYFIMSISPSFVKKWLYSTFR